MQLGNVCACVIDIVHTMHPWATHIHTLAYYLAWFKFCVFSSFTIQISIGNVYIYILLYINRLLFSLKFPITFSIYTIMLFMNLMLFLCHQEFAQCVWIDNRKTKIRKRKFRKIAHVRNWFSLNRSKELIKSLRDSSWSRLRCCLIDERKHL